MKNITLAIEEELLEKARALAARRHTSLNAMVREMLSHSVEQEDRVAKAKATLVRLMEKSTGEMGKDYVWNRDDLYAEREGRILSRLERSDLRGDGKTK